MTQLLFKKVDNTGLVLWRVAFGLLITIEAFGAIATGWVRRVFIEPDFTFTFIGFEFLEPLPGNGMYFYFALMGVFGILVTLGYKYRFAMASYALMWSGVYLMQKTSYNNHYYLMMLLCWIMVFLPANTWLSLDARQNPKLKSPSVGRWAYLVIILQIWIVYTYAAIAKLYPAWLDTSVAELFMSGKKDYWLIGEFLQLKWVHYSIAYVGILFDLLIVPAMLWKRTRLVAFCISLFFHLFNSVVFQIGIFPYMSIAFAFFFFSSETLQKRFLPKKKLYTRNEIKTPKLKPYLLPIFAIYFVIQIALPLRHWFFKDDVLWTEEGHRLSWRMMLRSRYGQLMFWTVDKETGQRNNYPYRNMLSKKQFRAVKTKPDLMWQMARKIKELEATKGNDVSVYVTSKVKINNGYYYPFIDPDIDLTAVPWEPFKHHEWILPSPDDYYQSPLPKNNNE
ncbi:MAG: HTTM domain-containing protein [Flavobacteriaceae bacterium]|nr:HTTM domain-containing protein [Flavobacteriaceae bacterium]